MTSKNYCAPIRFKPRVSVAFGKVEARGDIRFEDGKLLSVMSPRLLNTATDQPSAVAKYSNRFLSDKRFHAWRAVAKSSNHEGFMVAKSTWNQVLVVARSDYREWLELTTADTASLTDSGLIPPNAGNGAAPSGYIRKETEAAAAASVSEREPPLPLDPLFEHIHGALERNHCAPDDSRVLAMADALRAVCPDVTGEEAEHFIDLELARLTEEIAASSGEDIHPSTDRAGEMIFSGMPVITHET